jgi:hypothetical protein
MGKQSAMESQSLPQRFEFNRSTRVSQFIRAILVIVIGAAFFLAAFNLDRFISLPQNSPVGTVLKCIGGFVAVSGLVAFVILIVMLRSDTGQVIEVDDVSLTVHREGNKPSSRSLKWADVIAYEVIDNTTFLDLTSQTPYTTSQDTDLTGCLMGFILQFYVGLLQLFIGGSSTTIRFKLKAKRNMKVSGYGAPMDDLIDKTLSQYLPNKREHPGQKARPDSSQTTK